MGKGAFRWGLLGAGILAMMALGIGCGGSDSNSTALTKAQFVKQANAICQKSEQERSEAMTLATAEFKATGEKLTPKIQEEAILKVVEPYRRATQTLAGLDRPDGDEKKIEGIVQAMEEAYAKVKEDPRQVLTSTASFNRANKLALAYGLDDCKF
jgi:hypothetical protein